MSYLPLSRVTLASAASQVSFDSITQTYRDLVLVINGVAGASPNSVQPVFTFNNDTNSNYFYIFGRADSSGTIAGASSGPYNFGIINASVTSGSFMTFSNIMDYSATDKHKAVLTKGVDSDSFANTMFIANRWANTTAVTSIQISNPGGLLPSGTTLTLYGIAG